MKKWAIYGNYRKWQPFLKSWRLILIQATTLIYYNAYFNDLTINREYLCAIYVP